MQLSLESTTKIVMLKINGADVPARVWCGITSGGIPVHAFITRVAVVNGLDALAYAEFERDLEEHAAPTPAIEAIPARLIL